MPTHNSLLWQHLVFLTLHDLSFTSLLDLVAFWIEVKEKWLAKDVLSVWSVFVETEACVLLFVY